MKKAAVIVAGAVVLELGIFAVNAQAAGSDYLLKIKTIDGEVKCVQTGGSVVTQADGKYCKAAAVPVTKTPIPAKTEKASPTTGTRPNNTQ